MGLKTVTLEEGFNYLDANPNSWGEELVIIGLAAIASPEDIGRGFKENYILSHRIHMKQGNLESASAALHLAALVNEGIKNQEVTFKRRTELVRGIVHGRRRNIERLSV